jgi:hypothetical protein
MISTSSNSCGSNPEVLRPFCVASQTNRTRFSHVDGRVAKYGTSKSCKQTLDAIIVIQSDMTNQVTMVEYVYKRDFGNVFYSLYIYDHTSERVDLLNSVTI